MKMVAGERGHQEHLLSIVMLPARLGSTRLKSHGIDSAFFLKNRESKPIHRLRLGSARLATLATGQDQELLYYEILLLQAGPAPH